MLIINKTHPCRVEEATVDVLIHGLGQTTVWYEVDVDVEDVLGTRVVLGDVTQLVDWVKFLK